jgi:stress response protein SCP2
MSSTAKIDHEMTEHNGMNLTGNGAELSRQVTVALSSEQYERLFFQPSAPRRGDLAKRFGKSYICIMKANN